MPRSVDGEIPHSSLAKDGVVIAIAAKQIDAQLDIGLRKLYIL